MATHTETILITPDLARQYLKSNTHNRKLRKSRTDKLARDMRAGNWKETHQGIAFDEAGVLLDGQHRLAAIIESECPQRMPVTHDVPREAQINMDDHAPRSYDDALSLAGVCGGDINRNTVAIARQMINGENGVYKAKITKDEMAAFITDHKEAIDFSNAAHGGSGINLAAPVKAAIAVACYYEEAAKLKHFAYVFATGLMDGDKDSAAVVLRNHVLAHPEITRASDGRIDLYNKTLRAIRDFVEGRAVRRVSTQGGVKYKLP